jgi:phage gp46-like protein
MAEFKYVSGNPVMDQGVHNAAVISLFTEENWGGNAFLPAESQIGSDFVKLCQGTITLQKLNDVENSAVRALRSPLFPKVEAEARSPESGRLDVEISISPGGGLSIARENGLWIAQARNPEVK